VRGKADSGGSYARSWVNPAVYERRYTVAGRVSPRPYKCCGRQSY
jgi:hypothetical protein